MLLGKEDIPIYRFLGRILGKAVFDGITVDPQFANFFLRKLIGKSNSLNDLKSLDPELYKQLIFMKTYDGDVADLSLYFTVNDENLVTGTAKDVDLIPDGSNIEVTNQNKFRYIYLMADYRLNRRIKAQSDAFVNGFHECIPMKWLSIFSESELQMLMSGAAKHMDVKDLMNSTKYMGGFSKSSSTVKWFWKIVEK